MVPLVRIPGCSPELISYALNAGAGGIIMPHVQNVKQAEELVRLARFPPMGDRSFPPAALINEQQNRTPEGQTTYDVWNKHAAVICQIEDLQGLENIDEICKVSGGKYLLFSFHTTCQHIRQGKTPTMPFINNYFNIYLD